MKSWSTPVLASPPRPARPVAFVSDLLTPGQLGGRCLHSSTFQLDVSTLCGLHTSTFRLDVKTVCGLCLEVASAKTSQVELRGGRLLWLQ